MIAEVYDALLETGASQEKSRQAAEAVAVFDNRFSRLEQDGVSRAADSRDQIAAVRQEMAAGFARVDREITLIKAELRLLRWMTGATFAGVVAILIRLFFP